MTKLTFDANKVKPQDPLDPVPSGWYLAALTASDIKATPAKGGKAAGKRMEVEFTILDGECKGRKVFDGFNIENANPVAADIGQQQLSAVCHATGVFKFGDTKELHDKPFQLKVGFEPARKDETTKEEYDARNKYKGAKPVEGGATAAAGAGKALPSFVKKDPPGKPATPAAEAKLVWAAKKDGEGPFYVVINDETVEATLAELLGMLDKGMPTDTAAMLQSEENWQTVAEYAEQVAETPAEKPKPAPGKPKPAPAATEAKKSPPWAKK